MVERSSQSARGWRRWVPTTPPPGTVERGIWACILVAALAALVAAARIEPDPRGLGSHEQLGMRPCGWLTKHGTPCPSCGFTTTFALAMRGRFVAACRNQPFGFLLFLLAILSLPIGVTTVLGRFSPFEFSRSWPLGLFMGLTVTLWLLGWGYKWWIWPRS